MPRRPLDPGDDLFGRSRTPAGQAGWSARTKVHIGLMLVGLLGTGIMLYVTISKDDVARSMNSARHASIFENSLSLLAVPVTLFFAILLVYAVVELVRIYRATIDPNRYRKRRR